MFSVFWSPEVFLSRSVIQVDEPRMGNVGSIPPEMKHLGESFLKSQAPESGHYPPAFVYTQQLHACFKVIHP